MVGKIIKDINNLNAEIVKKRIYSSSESLFNPCIWSDS